MVMRSLLGPLFLLGLLLATPMGGQALELPDGSADAIRQVIERQIAAFRADDGAAAFGHASPTVRRIFGDVETFMTMVRRDYQPVYRPTTFEFREVVEWRGQPTQEVVVVGPDGAPWYTGNRQAHIGKLDPATGAIEEFPMPDPAARDPHTMAFDETGTMWFTVQGGNFVGRLSPERGEVGLIEVPTARARPYGIEVNSNGTPWFVEFGTNKIAQIEKEQMALTEFELPSPDARPRRLAITPDDMVWYVDYARGYLGRLNPETGNVTEWPTPGGSESRPYAMTSDDRGRLWFFETNPGVNRLVGFDPEREIFFSVTELESGGGTVRHMVFDSQRQDIWFGTDTNTIGRARLTNHSSD